MAYRIELTLETNAPKDVSDNVAQELYKSIFDMACKNSTLSVSDSSYAYYGPKDSK